MHYKNVLKKYKKIKGVSSTEPSRGSPVLTNFTVPHSSNEFSLFWNKKMVMNHRNHQHKAKQYEKGEICNYLRGI